MTNKGVFLKKKAVATVALLKFKVAHKFSFERKNHICSLFVRFWMKSHFPLKFQFGYSGKITIQIHTGLYDVKNSRVSVIGK